jgi:hypothetical protein
LPDLVDEVDEELRAERAKRLAQRFGGVAVGVALFVLAGVAGWEGWRWYERREAAAAAETYLTAMREASAEGADLNGAAQRFAEAGRGAPPGYRALAGLRAAALLAETGQREAALNAWNALAGDNAIAPLYRDLATVLWGLHAADSADPGQVVMRVTPLAAPGAPWRATAREVLFVLAVRGGQVAEARRQLDALLADEATPPALRERAGRLRQGLDG